MVQQWAIWAFFLSHIAQYSTEYCRSQQSGNASRYKQKKKEPQEKSALSIWKPRKGSTEDRKVLHNNIFTPSKHHWKHCGLSHSCLKTNSSSRVWEEPSAPQGWGQSRLSVKAGLSPRGHGTHWSPRGEHGLLSSQQRWGATHSPWGGARGDLVESLLPTPRGIEITLLQCQWRTYEGPKWDTAPSLSNIISGGLLGMLKPPRQPVRGLFSFWVNGNTVNRLDFYPYLEVMRQAFTSVELEDAG